MLRALTKIAICVAIGAGLGYFTATEWQKLHKKEDDWKAIEIRKLVTKDDIRVLDWRTKQRCR